MLTRLAGLPTPHRDADTISPDNENLAAAILAAILRWRGYANDRFTES
jgi:hypothetical protein